jgi:hypothetical protein
MSPPISPQRSPTYSKKSSHSPKQAATSSSKQSKLALKIKQAQQQKMVPEADLIEDLANPIEPLFLPPLSQPHVAPSAFASVLIEQIGIQQGIDDDNRDRRDSRNRTSGTLKAKRRSIKEQPLPPSVPTSNSGFAFDIPSPDDIVLNARKGTSLGNNAARNKSAHSASSQPSNTISSTPKHVSSRA